MIIRVFRARVHPGKEDETVEQADRSSAAAGPDRALGVLQAAAVPRA